MRKRRGLCYPILVSLSQDHDDVKQQHSPSISFPRMKTKTNHMRFSSTTTHTDSQVTRCRSKRLRKTYVHGGADMFDSLPDDLVISILSKLCASASYPSDFINTLIACKRLNGLGLHSQVLSKASDKVFAIKAKNWSQSAHKFFKLCADSGNVEACYTLGMIRFYCLKDRASGASLMAKAAKKSHAQALYSLAIIQFNGSGGTKSDKDLRAGVALCARAASLGHIDALREIGHCLQDGYGVKQNVIEGRRFLIQANARELVLSALCCSSSSSSYCINGVNGCPMLSDFGCNVPVREMNGTSMFLREWFAMMKPKEEMGGLRMCSHEGCGRPETRRHEFRRCSLCGNVNYCSRACQALDWKLRHKVECTTAAAQPENDVFMMMMDT